MRNNMRDLAFTSDSPQSIKLGDSNDVLSLKVTELSQPVDLSKVSSITVKIGNALGFLTDINIEVSSLKYPTDGRIDVVINSKLSSELPAGEYLLEVWIEDAQGNTVIYPDTSYPSVIGFSIKKNIMTATSTVITTLTLADFETRFDDMQKDLQDKVTSGYFKGGKGDPGEKGDTGTVDNAGLISAPAFQSLQSQVDNSAVGTNLLAGTAEFNPWNGASHFFPNGSLGLKFAFEKDSDGDTAWHLSGTANSSSIVGSYSSQLASAYPSTYAFSASVKGTFANTTLNEFLVEDSSNIISSINWSSTYSRWVVTGNIASGNGRSAVLYFDIKSGDTIDIWVKKWKLEKGSVATDWCPNPSEILTQSDYAKIKAAIVALGGALS